MTRPAELWRIERFHRGETEVLGWWPCGRTAALIARHYRRECPGVVRVRRERPGVRDAGRDRS